MHLVINVNTKFKLRSCSNKNNNQLLILATECHKDNTGKWFWDVEPCVLPHPHTTLGVIVFANEDLNF